MMRMFCLISAVLLTSAISIDGAAAQGKARNPKCSPTYKEQCYKACAARGGQIRLCAPYCDKQQREAGCS